MNTKYVSKPSYVEAIAVLDILFCAANNWKGLPKWVVEAYDQGQVLFTPRNLIYKSKYSSSTSSWAEADDSHMFVMDSNGDLNAFKKDIFTKYYDKVGDDKIFCKCNKPAEVGVGGYRYDKCYDCWWAADPRNKK